MDITRLTPYRSCSPGISNFGSGVTHQEFRDICDINNILRRFRATGVLPQCQGLVSMPCDSFLYGDFSDLQNTLNGAKNVHDLANEVVTPLENASETAPDSVQKEGVGENGTVNGDGVKGEATPNPGA